MKKRVGVVYMFCNRCGYQNQDNAKFCEKCGNNLFNETNNNLKEEKVPDSIIRRSIKLDAKRKPKGPLYGAFAITVIAGILLSFLLVGNINYNTLELETNMPSNVIVTSLLILLIYAFVTMFLNIGITKASLDISRDKQITIGDIFKFPFKNFTNSLKMIGVGILASIILVVVELIPFIGSIAYLFLVYYYGPALIAFNFIMIDNAENNLSVTEAIKKAAELIKGHRVAFYSLIFSFIGWYLLGGLTLGILLIWVVPYLNVSLANFYRKLLKEKEYTDATPGLSDKAVIGIFIGGILTFIILIIIIAAVTIVISSTSITTQQDNSDYIYEDTYENNDNYYEDTYDAEIETVEGLNIYVPSNFIETQIDGYTKTYMSYSQNTVLGVMVQEDLTEQASSDDYANAMRYFMSDEYTCSEVETKTLNGEDWKVFDCEGLEYNIRCYMILRGTTGYIVTVTYENTALEDTYNLFSELEENLSFEIQSS